MKSSIAIFALLILSSVLAPAQSSSTAPDFKIAPGTIIPTELTKSIDSKKVKEGDPVVVKLSVDMLSGGTIIVPRDSKFVGHVTEAKVRGKDKSESTLGIVFDRLILKNGQELPLQAIVQAVGPPLVVNMRGPADQNPGAYGNSNTNPGGYAAHQTMGAPRSPANPDGTPGSDDQPGNFGGVQPLPANATGVLGMPGLTLRDTSSASSVLVTEKKNVKLDSGTQLLLRTCKP